jgi:hypothetical protein
MASFDIAFDWTMQWEDPHRTYKEAPDAAPAGFIGKCFSIAGINSGAFPLDYRYIVSLPTEERAVPVKAFYRSHFWNQWLEQLQEDELAKRVYDMGVNAGLGTAVKLLQNCLAIHADGVLGPLTVKEANEHGPGLVDTYKAAREQHYREIVEKHPSNAQYLDGWLARARA